MMLTVSLKRLPNAKKNIDLVLGRPSMCQSHTLLNEVLYIIKLASSLEQNNLLIILRIYSIVGWTYMVNYT